MLNSYSKRSRLNAQVPEVADEEIFCLLWSISLLIPLAVIEL
jgi:hypothetical protein